MGQIERGANRIYGVERDRPTLAKYTRAAILALTAGTATVLALVVLVAGRELGDAVKEVTGLSDTVDTVWNIARWPLSAALVIGAVALMFERSAEPPPAVAVLACLRFRPGGGALVCLHRDARRLHLAQPGLRRDVRPARRGDRA